MAQEYLLGRSHSETVKIPSTKVSVSGTHAKITVSDNGTWELEDLNSPNGVYIRDENGDFQKVFKKQINESSIIRLGKGGADSFVFTAHRILCSDDSYSYEFHQLRKQLKMQLEEEAKQEKKVSLHGWITKLSGIIAIGLTYVISKDMDPLVRCSITGAMPAVLGLAFIGDGSVTKSLKKQRTKLLRCPKCGHPISDFDIENRQCSRCKAH